MSLTYSRKNIKELTDLMEIISNINETLNKERLEAEDIKAIGRDINSALSSIYSNLAFLNRRAAEAYARSKGMALEYDEDEIKLMRQD